MLSRLAAAVTACVLTNCTLTAPLPKSKDVPARLQAFPTSDLPLERRVTIYWSKEQIPFVEAKTDGDAAFALGLVHAHLRLGQMATARMIAHGRVSEMVGPRGIQIDHALRTLSYGQAAKEIELGMDESARLWVQRFVAGINHYQDTAAELPHEFGKLGIRPEPWTVADIVAIGRLAGSDVNWFVWAGSLPLRDREDWPELWARMVANGSDSQPSFEGDVKLGNAMSWLNSLSRSGSNSIAVAPRLTQTGGALIASDPHLGIMIPSLWLVAGVKSPSYHVVGLMGPGLPVFAIGRNQHIGWGGTNMRSASSELYDVSELQSSEISSHSHRIGVRWWRDSKITVRRTPIGPIVTDVPFLESMQLPPLALKWIGHEASDEIGAMLAASRASNFAEYREALDSFAVPGQNMIYADVEGNIGQVMATRVPVRLTPPADLIADAADNEATWRETRSAITLPYSYNPREGFLASANNRPAATGFPVGFFYSTDDRVQRMASLVKENSPVGVSTLMNLQQDVYMASADELRQSFVSGLDRLGISEGADAESEKVIERLRHWNGEYRQDSVGAVTFEQFRYGFSVEFYRLHYADGAELRTVGAIAEMLGDDIKHADAHVLAAALRAGLQTAASRLDEYKDWGEMHRLQLTHPLSRAPIIGKRYKFGETGIGGSSQTLMKTAHTSTAERHSVTYGSNARHVSDLTDPDANYFVLLGGQDGWFNSTTMLDQWELWRDGRYVRVPLAISTIRDSFPFRLDLEN